MARVTREELLTLQEVHKTDAAVGTFLGISRQAVHQLRSKFIVTPIKRKSEPRNLEIQQEYQNGVPGTELARRYNLSVSQTYRILGEMKKSLDGQEKTRTMSTVRTSVIEIPHTVSNDQSNRTGSEHSETIEELVSQKL